jgi:hypothetical protein
MLLAVATSVGHACTVCIVGGIHSPVLRTSMFTVPDQLLVLVNFFYPVQRDIVQYSIMIIEIKREMIAGLEEYLA